MSEPETAAWPKAITAITLFVEDLAACKQFYAAAFALPVIFETEDSAVFKVGGVLVNLLLITSAPELVHPARVADAAAGVRQVITIAVPDVDAVCAQLASRGVKSLNGPMDRPWGVRTASFQDPAGHVWEISA
jgi:catechol 2,3-dioxygenase-like lactoylglutathione lyase family enzyme